MSPDRTPVTVRAWIAVVPVSISPPASSKVRVDGFGITAETGTTTSEA